MNYSQVRTPALAGGIFRAIAYAALASLVTLVVGACQKRALPLYSIDDGPEILVTRVMAQRFDRLSLPAVLSPDSRAMARRYAFIQPSEMPDFSKLKPSGPAGVALAKRDIYFDLWSTVRSLSEDLSDTAIGLEFNVHAPSRSTIYLGLGASDEALVYCNGDAVSGVRGFRENLHTHHLFPVSLNAGPNRVLIVLQTAKKWTHIPEDNLSPEWACNIQLYTSLSHARTRHRQRMAHVFDTPVVQDFEDLRIDTGIEKETELQIFDMAGRLVASGMFTPVGRPKWKRIRAIREPFVGIAKVEGDVAEPILIFGSQGIEHACSELLKRIRDFNGPWAYRLRHLLQNEFETQRDLPWSSWARKVTITAAKLLAEEGVTKVLENCPSMDVELSEYRSSVDGTPQYFRYQRQRQAENARTLLIVLPTAPGVMRPYLELIADLQNTERTGGFAKAYGMDVLWTGGVSPDYGGRLARREVLESIDAYFSKFPPGPQDRMFLIAPCSAGVTALGLLADGFNVDGAVFWTPVLHRYRTRWARGRPVLPDDVFKAERTDEDLAPLKEVPMLVYWDCDESGHGDRAGSASFVERARDARCPVDAFWLNPAEPRFLWGLREVASIEGWMKWVKGAPVRPHKTTPSALHVRKAPSTIKDALLNGFYLASTPTDSPYLVFWREEMLKYRAASNQNSPQVAGTTVRESIVSSEDFRTLFRPGMDSYPILKEKSFGTKAGEHLWGVRLVADGSGIEIFSTGSGKEFPPIDLLVDGLFHAAVWRKEGARWTVVQVWQKRADHTSGGDF